jgi:Tol biopolymer transport system component
VYVVGVDGGEHALIAESLGQIPTGEEGTGIAWSPDGTRLAVLADKTLNASPWSARLYVMNADGSERSTLAEGVLTQHTLGSTNIAWSPDGTRIAYATVPDDAYAPASGKRDPFTFRVWSAAPDGSHRVLVFDATERANGVPGGPVWSPDGTQIAFRWDAHPSQRSYLVANADETGNAHEIDELRYMSWRDGWYFCECYG